MSDHQEDFSAVAGGSVMRRDTRATRSSGAKTALRLVAVLGVIGTIVGCSGSSDDDIAALEADVAAARAEVATVEGERDTLAGELETATEQAEQAESAAAEVIDELDAAAAKNEELAAEVAAETERANTAEAALAELGDIADGFPLILDASLIPENLPGTYNISFAEAYCDGFATCGSVPTATQATVTTTPEGFLRIAVPGILDAGLFALEGSLYAITDSFTALPQCNGADQRARVTLTLYADDATITEDFTRQVDSIGASITIDTPYEGPDCPNGLVFYASSFTPAG